MNYANGYISISIEGKTPIEIEGELKKTKKTIKIVYKGKDYALQGYAVDGDLEDGGALALYIGNLTLYITDRDAIAVEEISTNIDISKYELSYDGTAEQLATGDDSDTIMAIIGNVMSGKQNHCIVNDTIYGMIYGKTSAYYTATNSVKYYGVVVEMGQARVFFGYQFSDFTKPNGVIALIEIPEYPTGE